MPVLSDRCGLDELFLSYETGDAGRARLALGPGWTREWTATWQVSGGDEVSLVRDLGPVPVAGCEPVRRFSWGRRQRHRPGLQFMVSTGRVHGFESLEEQALLLALDFTGALEDVLPQPFTLRFGTADSGFLRHVPDFLAVFRDGSPVAARRPAREAGQGRRRDALRRGGGGGAGGGMAVLGGGRVAPASQWPSQLGKKEKEGPCPREGAGRPGGQGQARPGARRRRPRGGSGSPPLAGADVPGPRRD